MGCVRNFKLKNMQSWNLEVSLYDEDFSKSVPDGCIVYFTVHINPLN